MRAAAPDKLEHAMFQIYGITGMAGGSVGRPEESADGSSRLSINYFREGYALPMQK